MEIVTFLRETTSSQHGCLIFFWNMTRCENRGFRQKKKVTATTAPPDKHFGNLLRFRFFHFLNFSLFFIFLHFFFFLHFFHFSFSFCQHYTLFMVFYPTDELAQFCG